MNIQERLSALFKEYKGQDVSVNKDTTFDELGFDSLDKVEMLMKIEEEYNIAFSDDFNIETVGQLVEKIEKLIKK